MTVILPLATYYWDDQIKDDEMDRACSQYEADEK
jgi:hypothetical protein